MLAVASTFRFPNRLVAAGLLAVSAASAGTAAAAVPPTLWTPGDAGSTFQAWDVFASTLGPNAPDAGLFNPNDDAADPLDLNAFDANAPGNGAFLVGGNIYSFQGIVSPVADVPGYGGAFASSDFTTVLVNLTTRGSVPDFDTLQLTADGQPVPLTGQVVLTASTPLGGFGGSENSYWMQFNFAGSFEALRLAVTAGESSMSLAGLRIDTLTSDTQVVEAAPPAVPEPGSLALTMLAGPMLLRRRR
ncbi:MAG: PEP-CTERM sorting domain-containing protein [Phycisphaerae bacterium]